jgi:hypothetical protein
MNVAHVSPASVVDMLQSYICLQSAFRGPQFPARLDRGEGIEARADAGALGICSDTCIPSPPPRGLILTGVGATDALLLGGVLDGMPAYVLTSGGLGGMGDAPVDLDLGGLGIAVEATIVLVRRSGVGAADDAPFALVGAASIKRGAVRTLGRYMLNSG